MRTLLTTLNTLHPVDSPNLSTIKVKDTVTDTVKVATPVNRSTGVTITTRSEEEEEETITTPEDSVNPLLPLLSEVPRSNNTVGTADTLVKVNKVGMGTAETRITETKAMAGTKATETTTRVVDRTTRGCQLLPIPLGPATLGSSLKRSLNRIQIRCEYPISVSIFALFPVCSSCSFEVPTGTLLTRLTWR